MKVNFTFRHMDSSQQLKDHTLAKLERLQRYEDQELSIHAIFSIEKFHKMVEFTAHSFGHTFVSHDMADDMFEAIDLAADKLDRQFKREKTKRKHHKGLQGSTPQTIG
jgi:putative sigma-54 modulation protein